MTKEVQKVSTGYFPRPWQDREHRINKRWKVLVLHRRAGKSHFATNDMCDYLLNLGLKNPQGAYIAPTFSQAKRVLWVIAKDYFLKIPGATANEADLKITIPRPSRGDFVTFLLLGAENPDGLRGLYLDYAVLDEVAQMNPTVWTMVVRPALSDRLGRALFIGTCNGRGFFYQLYDGALNGFPQEDGTRKKDPDWHAFMLKADESGIIPQDELDSARAIMSAESFAQEYLCDFNAGMVGAYFAKEMALAESSKRVCSVPYDASLPVDTYWDLGINDVTAVWFVQQHRTSYRVIRYDEAPDLKISEWATRTKKHGYELGKCFLPHDVKVRELTTGKSRLEEFERLFGRRAVKVVPRVEDKLDSINAARVILGKCWFDVGNCKRGLDALAAYQRRWDEKSQTFSPKPLHTWASNGSDAFQCFAMGASEREEINERELVRSYETDDTDPFTHARRHL